MNTHQRRSATRLLIGMLSVIALARTGTADTIFDSLGSWGSNSSPYAIPDATGSGNVRLEGFQFTPLATGYVSQIELPLLGQAGATSATVLLETDNSGLPSDTVLYSSAVTLPSPDLSLVTINPSTPPLLQAGTEYWLVVENSTPGSMVNWGYDASRPTTGLEAVYTAAMGWLPVASISTAAFQITASPAPEPPTLWLAICGLGGLGFAAWRKRRGSVTLLPSAGLPGT